MRRNALRALLAISALIALIGLAGCGAVGASPQATGRGASIAVSLKVVPTIRSVTVSPATARFGNCIGGSAGLNTGSTPGALGYPNGHCWLGKQGSSFPITVTNSGIASYIDVSGSNAVPSDGGTQWSLCNRGAHPVVTCTSSNGTAPGIDQYTVVNFAPGSGPSLAGLTDTPACDTKFGPGGSCWTTNGESQQEGIELTGPATPDDSSTSWTVTITWMPVPK
jgi:hypothetical protein